MSGFTDMEIETGDEKYLKIKPSESVQIHILSKEPMRVANHWINKKKSECEGKNCEHCANGDKPKKVWRVKIWDRKTLNVKEYEFGPQIASQIKNIAELLSESQETVDSVDFRIKREGADLETEYFVLQVPMKESVPASARQLGEVPF